MLSLNQLTCVAIDSVLLAKAEGRLFESTGRNVDVSHTRPFGFRDDSLSILGRRSAMLYHPSFQFLPFYRCSQSQQSLSTSPPLSLSLLCTSSQTRSALIISFFIGNRRSIVNIDLTVQPVSFYFLCVQGKSKSSTNEPATGNYCCQHERSAS